MPQVRKTNIFLRSSNFLWITDYDHIDRNITFSSNDPYCEDINIVDDDVVEETEVFSIELSSSDPRVLFGQFTSTTVTVLDNDGSETRIMCLLVAGSVF